jgi:predicted ATP-grasp superfamily ATP-dependent carboligase
MSSDPAVLIAAVSGRALALSARRGGYAPLVVDFFADQDTVAIAAAHVRLRGSLARGINADELLAALETLAARYQPRAIVCGTGFEDRPDLLARASRRWKLFGNSPVTVTLAKDPLALAVLCRECGVPYPETSLVQPASLEGWLRKRRGGAGGSHVGIAPDGAGLLPNTYFQRRVDGIPISALVLAGGRRASVLGFSSQWASPAPSKPFRYGGAVRPAPLPPVVSKTLTAAIERLAASIPLVGLNSVDFLLDGEEFWLLEINPRPGATLDIFEPAEGSLFSLHMAACEGELPSKLPSFDGAEAAAIVYAEHDVPSLPHLDWPDWTADRPQAGIAVQAGDPLCTVRAVAATAAEARRLVEERGAAIRAWTRMRVA